MVELFSENQAVMTDVVLCFQFCIFIALHCNTFYCSVYFGRDCEKCEPEYQIKAHVNETVCRL